MSQDSTLIHIRRRKGLIDINWEELWHYRDLLVQMVSRDFSSKYKQTVLGPLWFILQPLATTIVFTVVFTGIAEISTDGMPPALFYLTALLAWNYFSTAVNSVSGCLRANVGILSKVYFPRLILPLAGALSSGIGLSIQIVTWLIVYYSTKLNYTGALDFGITSQVWLFPLLILQCGLLAIGVGLIFAALTAKYRDLSHAMQFLTQAWMYVTPIIYPLSKVPEKWQWLVMLNPMTAIVEAMRLILLGHGSFDFTMVAVSWIFTIGLVFLGLVMFTRAERSFVDII